MNIELSKEQLANIIRATCIATDIIGLISDMVSEDYKKRYEEIEDLKKYLLNCAEKNGYNQMFDYYNGHIITGDYITWETDEIGEEYDEFIFWDELEHRLAIRDMDKTLSKEEKDKIFKDYLLYLKKLDEFTQKYSKEFQKYGVGRLEIKE